MNHVGVNGRMGVAAEQPKGAPAVGIYPVALVGDGHAQIKRIKRGMANASVPGKHRVLDAAVVEQRLKAEHQYIVCASLKHYNITPF
jgi:hypothetical protein